MNEVLNQPTKRKSMAFEKRVHEVDFIRGILILFVIVDHFLSNLGMHGLTWYEITGIEFWNQLYGVIHFYWFSLARIIVRCVILALFCFVSGLSCSFSKNNWKRAAETLILAGIIAFGSNVIDALHLAGVQTMRIDFNIIAVLGWSTLIYCFFQDKDKKYMYYGIGFLFMISAIVVPSLLLIPNITDAYFPPFWEPAGQADYMPLFPYIIFFFVGALLARYLYKEKKSLFKRREWERWICFLGRHTLIIYLGHNVIFIGIFYLIDVIVRAIHG